MTESRRSLSLRLAALTGLAASAALAADALRPGERSFCPLEKACDAARSSAFGSLFGVPTSLIGVGAFLGLLLLSMWRHPRRHAALRAAGLVAAASGSVLVAYQGLALGGFCPLCLLADAAGIAVGVIALRGSALRGRTGSGSAPLAESGRARRAWIAAGVLLAAAILLWPRAARPSWTSIAGKSSEAEGGAVPAISLTEYLNPFCSHCRATHARLARVLTDLAPAIRRRRLYVWSGGGTPPYWAQACVCAQDQGDLRERALFRELLAARDESRGEVIEAARRSGLDVPALEACIAGGAPLARLERVRRIVLEAKIEGMPTIDVGLRRLEGEQSEQELRTAVEAAKADLARGALR